MNQSREDLELHGKVSDNEAMAAHCPNDPPEERKYSTRDVCRECGVNARQAQNICHSVLNRRPTRYRMTEDEFGRVLQWYASFGYKNKNLADKLPFGTRRHARGT